MAINIYIRSSCTRILYKIWQGGTLNIRGNRRVFVPLIQIDVASSTTMYMSLRFYLISAPIIVIGVFQFSVDGCRVCALLFCFTYIYSQFSAYGPKTKKNCAKISLNYRLIQYWFLKKKMHFSQNLFAFSGGVCEYEISTIFSKQNQLSVMWKESGQWFKCIYDFYF